MVDSNTNTLSRAVGAGANRALIVAIGYYDGSSTRTISSVKFNTTETFTEVAFERSDWDAGDCAALYVLKNPTNTTANVVVTFSDAVLSAISITEWNGVDQTTPTHDASIAWGESATATVNVANVLTGEVTIDACVTKNDPTPQKTGQMEVIITSNYRASSQIDITGTGTVTMSYTQSSTHWVIVACALNAV